MTEIIVAGFKGETTADEVLINLEKAEQIHTIKLDEAVIAIRKTDGAIKIKHSNELVLTDSALGSAFGMVIAGPVGLLVGGLIGAALGETLKVLTHVGISDQFVTQVAEILEPGNSAIFIQSHRHISNDIVAELEKFDGQLLRSSLDIKGEDELRAALEQHVPLKQQ